MVSPVIMELNLITTICSTILYVIRHRTIQADDT